MSGWTGILTGINVFIYHISNGYVGSRLGKQSVLLLHTTGRRTGKQHITSLSYYRDGDNYLIVGSNWGRETHPGWFYNLMNNPQATIEVRSKTIPVEAHQAVGDEYQRLWQLVARLNPQYLRYQKGMKRRLPIVILTPSA